MSARTGAGSALTAVRRNWLRVLVGVLGGCQVLMAAGATGGVVVVGVVSGIALIAGAIVAPAHRAIAGAAFALGTIPFVAVAWTALVPILVTVLVAALAAPVLRRPPASAPAPTPDAAGCHGYDGHDSDHGEGRRGRDDDHAGEPTTAG